MKDAILNILKSDNFLSGMDFSIQNAEPGLLELSLPLDQKLLRPGDFMNGGAVMTVLDAAGGLSVMTYGDVANEVTINMSTNFLRAVRKGPLTVIAKVTKRGRNITFSKIELLDGDRKLCAEATGSWFIVKPEDL
jgi:uncharacterized protein (TIGR00369 family)